MDSLTQITLGAACGELVLGKKLGNRAMLWGAVGGTIPDLDVIANFFTDEMTALAFHRGISHSLLFAVLIPIPLAWLTHRFYQSDTYMGKKYKAGFAIFGLLILSTFLGLLNYIPIMAGSNLNIGILAGSLLFLLGTTFLIRKYYYNVDLNKVEASQKDWFWLFFWSIFTHSILDTFTAYGTQLFQPFNDSRIAFNVIAVVDPLYTVPFIVCLLIAAVMNRTNKLRRNFAILGVVVSSLYMLYCTVNKFRVDKIFAQSLETQNISFERFRTSPTIINNILWYGVAEDEKGFHYGFYSFFDKEPKVDFHYVKKNHQLLDAYQGDKHLEILNWFSHGYYNVLYNTDGELQLNDMRFGTIGDGDAKPEDYIFKFILKEQPNGVLEASQSEEMPGFENTFDVLWTRIKGK